MSESFVESGTEESMQQEPRLSRRAWLRNGSASVLSMAAMSGGYYYMQRPMVTPLYFDGHHAFAHVTHPPIIHAIVRYANDLTEQPYRRGGGHRVLFDQGFDCSGSISHVLYRAGLIRQSMDSKAFSRFGIAGHGMYVTLYVRPGQHVFMVVCGLRFDTSGRPSENGPRWHEHGRDFSGFQPRHPASL
jgi:hypothetical protein